MRERMGMVIGIHQDKITEYKRLHAAAWPEVLNTIKVCNIENYTIFLREPENLLFAYWEYTGVDFEADMKRMAEFPITQEWWALCSPCQHTLPTIKQGEYWSPMEQVFHTG